MKRIFAPSLLALACSAAMAQSDNIRVYGIIDAGINHVSGLANGDDNAVVSGIMDGSRLGFRGEEEISPGWRALFRLEHRLEVNNGTISNRPVSGSQVPDRLSDATLLGLPVALQPAVDRVAPVLGSQIGVNLPTASKPYGAFWDRTIYVGLVTPVGAVIMGRQYTPAYETVFTFDALATQSSLSAGQASAIPASVTIRADNAATYRIEKGPVSASLMYALGDVPGESDAHRLVGLQAAYKTDAFEVGAGYQTRNNELGEKSLTTTVLGAKAKLGPGTLSGLYAIVKDDHPDGLSAISGLLQQGGLAKPLADAVQGAFTQGLIQDARQYQIGYKLETGPHTVYVAYNMFDDKRPNNADLDTYGAVYSYALSKRTDLNFVLVHFNNKGLAQAAPGQAGFLGGVTKSAGTDSNNIAMGVRHKF